MKEKMLDLMKSEGLEPSQLAELLGIKPAGISHILAERNKPKLRHALQKILRRFPRLNPDWLLLDSDQMYRDNTDGTPRQPAPTAAAGPAITDGLFGASGSSPTKAPHQEPTSAIPENSVPTTAVPFPGTRTDVAVRRIVVLYDDMTFESFTPTKH